MRLFKEHYFFLYLAYRETGGQFHEYGYEFLPTEWYEYFSQYIKQQIPKQRPDQLRFHSSSSCLIVVHEIFSGFSTDTWYLDSEFPLRISIWAIFERRKQQNPG